MKYLYDSAQYALIVWVSFNLMHKYTYTYNTSIVGIIPVAAGV